MGRVCGLTVDFDLSKNYNKDEEGTTSKRLSLGFI